jgi:hypothetical protein
MRIDCVVAVTVRPQLAPQECRPIEALARSHDHDATDYRPDRGKTVTESLVLSQLGLCSSEKQIPQVVETIESG